MSRIADTQWNSDRAAGAATAAGQANLVQDFLRRGAAVPFTTAGLSNSRVRSSTGGALEVLIPGFGGAKGTYVVPMKDLPLALVMSVHDRVMHQLILERHATNPDGLRLVMLEVARQGLAGPQAALEAVQALEREQVDRLVCAVHLIRLAFAKVDGGGEALTLAEITSQEGQARVRALLATMAKETGGSADALYKAIEEWGDVIAAVGTPEMEPPSRLRRLARTVAETSTQIWRWAQEDEGPDGERALQLSELAKNIGATTKSLILRIDFYLENFVDTIVRWADTRGEIALLVDQLSWTLDGWDRHIETWRDAAQSARPLQVVAIHAIADGFPERIRKAAPPAAAAKAAERNPKIGRLAMGQDWRTGRPSTPAATKPGATKPAGKPEERAAVASHVGTMGDRQFDLSENQLGKLVGVLEKARDTQGGDSLSKDAFDAIRPRLKVSQPRRTLTVERLFCVPFEDLLADGSVPPSPGRILRASIRPCWKLAEAGLPKELLAEMEAKAAAAGSRDHTVVVDLGQRLWPTASATVSAIHSRANADPAERTRLAQQLGDRGFADFTQMGQVLEVADPVMRLRGFLTPKPVMALDKDKIAGILGVFDIPSVALRLPEMLRVLLSRVAEPIDLLQALAAAAADDPRARKLGIAVRVELVADLQARIDALAGAEPPSPNVVAALAEEAAERFKALGEMPQGGEAMIGDGVAKMKERIVATLRDVVIAKAEPAIMASFVAAPAAKDAATALQDMAKAEAHATALKQCAGFAESLGLGGEVNGKLTEIAMAVERATVERLGAEAAAPAPAQPDARVVMFHAVRLLEICSNANRADKLRLKIEQGAGAAPPPAKTPTAA
ncbi:MAG: hypothetical protein IT562_15645 [Alphaproteobacteria bacterium]|nr:hypothetical protein [Alphaproteobacteria bacterium]